MIAERSGILVWAAIGLALAAAGGCGRRVGTAPAVWVASDMAALTDQTKPFVDPIVVDADMQSVNLFAAANETVSFQVVIDADAGELRDIKVRLGELSGPGGARIAAARFSAFQALPVRVTSYPAWYLRLAEKVPEPVTHYDALVPMEAPDIGPALDPQRRLVVWVDLAVPGSARAGDYSGSLTVSAAGRADAVRPIKLKVYGFVLPDARPLAAVGGFDHKALFSRFIQRDGVPFVPVRMDLQHPQVKRGLVLMRQLMRLGHAHRLDLFDTTMTPLLKRDLTGKVKLDWTEYDAVVLPYLSGTAFDDRVAVAAWPIPFSEAWPPSRPYGGADSATYRETAAQILAQCGKHAQALAKDSGRLFVWPRRGGADAAAYDQFISLAKLVRAAGAELPILSTLPANPPQPTGWTAPKEYASLVDIHCPSGEFFDPAPVSPGQGSRRLAGLWFTPGQPPYTPALGVVSTPCDARAIPWFAMRYDCTGLLIGEVMNWPADPYATAAGAEARLFYPGNAVGRGDEVLPSVRLKRLRRGLQDIAYLWLLRQRKRQDLADSLARAMARYAGVAAAGDQYQDVRLDGWVAEPAAWEMARRLMAVEIEAALAPVPPSDHDVQLRRMDWQEFEEKVYSVRVEQVRTRVVELADGRLRASVLLDLYNEFRRDVSVVAALGDLPPGWTNVKATARLAMPAATRGVVELTAEGATLPAGTTGKMSLPVNVTVDRRRQRHFAAGVPFVIALPAASAVTIDGALGDWPIRPANAAGAFTLVGRRGRTSPLAARQTLVQVLRDENFLYIAFRCDEPQIASLVSRADNSVHYEQLMACGEDLVEIILDPGRTAQSAEDLYHLLIKPTGVVVAERGVGCRPPLGKCSPWPVAYKAAVARENGQWRVEMAIPLAAFAQAGTARLWGVNFARFATAGSESSSWSGAARHFYDPRNLGTMYLRPPGGATPQP
ncbi:MAG: hypothetical protein ABFD92_05860 [Planctomycetaceae bacterium]|nr:DUF4091 domain-containing protein [Planctomycetaceae bacterium]